MLSHFRRLHARVRQVFFGPAYHPADHSALTPRGGAKGVRAMLLVVGSLWVSLVVFDLIARPWQRQPKSWRFFQGLREFNEAPNISRRIDPTRTNGPLAGDVGVISLTKPYVLADDTMRAYIETDAQGFRAVSSQPPYAVALCGDSFSNNNSFADSLARYTGLSVGNQAIEGRGTLTMARFLEDKPVAYQQAHLVIWESTQRAGLDDFNSLPARRRQLRQATAPIEQWRESLLWPANLEVYLTGSSLLKPLLDKTQKEIKWKLTHKSLDLIILGRTDLPEKVAPILYMAGDEGLRPVATSAAKIDSIANYIATVNRDLQARGQQLVFLIAPDKSVVYANRLPADIVPRTNYITGLNQALQQRGVKVVDVTIGLQKAAQDDPQRLYYYSADTHWTPLGMRVASRIVADSLTKWSMLDGSKKSVGISN